VYNALGKVLIKDEKIISEKMISKKRLLSEIREVQKKEFPKKH
jgi:hypothetical protein